MPKVNFYADEWYPVPVLIKDAETYLTLTDPITVTEEELGILESLQTARDQAHDAFEAFVDYLQERHRRAK